MSDDKSPQKGLTLEEEKELLEDIESTCGLSQLGRPPEYPFSLKEILDSRPDFYPTSNLDRRKFRNRVHKFKQKAPEHYIRHLKKLEVVPFQYRFDSNMKYETRSNRRNDEEVCDLSDSDDDMGEFLCLVITTIC